MPSRIAGTGRYLPERVLTNEELARTVDTSDEWIRSRTGIRQRHIAAPHEATSDLALHASRAALAAAGIDPADVDLIIVATTTPDMVFPSTACILQAKLGAQGRGRIRRAGGVLRIRLRPGIGQPDARQRHGAQRPRRRRRDLLANSRLVGAWHLRAVRRRRRRGRPGAIGDAGNPDLPPARGRKLCRHPVRAGARARRRDFRHALRAHGRRGGVQVRRKGTGRSGARRRSGPRTRSPATSTGSFRTRPTSGSWTRR